MALTVETIKAVDTLASLSTDQLAAIATLSANDEKVVLGTEKGKLYGMFDTDIKTVAGIDKNGDEPTHEYLKRALTEFKTKAEKAETLTAETTTLKTEITALKKAIAEGNGDAVVKQELKDAQDKLKALETQLNTEKENWTKEKESLQTEISQTQIDTQFEKASSGLKFKAVYPAKVQASLLKEARAEILTEYKPDWVETDSKKIMVFRDSKGEIARNPKNLMHPFTAEELLQSKLGEVLEVERKKTGTETTDPKTGVVTVELVDISAARTQVEADDLIIKHLLQLGLTKGSPAFSKKQAEIRKEQKVSALPVR